MSQKINKSWEKTRVDVHSPTGVADLRRNVKWGLMRKYMGIAETMFRYEGLDAPAFEDMGIMSRDQVPEKFLMRNGSCVWFQDPATGQMHCLPYVADTGINMYGNPSGWYPVPVDRFRNGFIAMSSEAERYHPLVDNLAYNLQYIQFLEKELMFPI